MKASSLLWLTLCVAISNTQPPSTLSKPDTNQGIWSHSIIDNYISRGYHPLVDVYVDDTTPKTFTLTELVEESVRIYIEKSYEEYLKEIDTIKNFTDDFTDLLSIDDLNEPNGT